MGSSSKKLSWVVFWQASAPQLDTIGQAGGVNTRDRVLVSEAEVQDYGQDVTVLRIVGEFAWFMQNPAAAVDRPFVLAAGVLMRESLDKDAGAPNILDPEVVEEYPWAWLRTWSGIPDGVSSQGQQGMADAVTPGTALEKIDIRVKRKLRTGQELLFQTASRMVSFGSNALPSNADLFMYSWLRVRILIES